MIPVLRTRIGMLDLGNTMKNGKANDVEARQVLVHEELADIHNPGGDLYLTPQESSTEWDAMPGS